MCGVDDGHDNECGLLHLAWKCDGKTKRRRHSILLICQSQHFTYNIFIATAPINLRND